MDIKNKKIDYTKYTSTSGMSTKHFGPCLWDFMFMSILGTYPVILDYTNIEHLKIMNSFRLMLTNLQYILPCIYCRKSYSQFIIQLPLTKQNLQGRIPLFYWLYLMKDKVNQKLINQETQLINSKIEKYKGKYYNNKEKFTIKINNVEKKYRKTIPTPPFKQILDKYEQYRAKCVDKTKKCSIDKLHN